MSFHFPAVFFFFTVILGLSPNFSLFAQDGTLMMTNSKPIDENRYSEIKGNPYLFKDWQTGSIVDKDDKMIENVLLNYNGETENIEIRQGDKFIELEVSDYKKIIIPKENAAETILIKGAFSPFKDQFVRVVYANANRKVIQTFESQIITKVFNNVGKNEEFKSFYNKKQYYLISDKAQLFKLKKKSLLPLLTERSQLEQFLKKEKMKLNSEEQLLKLLAYYEQIGKN